MDYEEKRELKKQISQLLADAGLNQGRIKEIVEEEIRHKVDRAVEQVIAHLNAQSSSGDFFQETIRKWMHDKYMNSYAFTDAIKRELCNKIISITLKDAVLEADKESTDDNT